MIYRKLLARTTVKRESVVTRDRDARETVIVIV
jgi:hypothetical protein